MANSFITLKQIARRALPRLMDQLMFPSLIYRDYSNSFSELGDTVQLRKPVLLSASEFDQSAGVNYEDIRESSVDVVLNRLATVDVAAGAVESALNLNSEEALERDFIAPAAAALAEKINSDGLLLYRDVAACAGQAGSTPGSLAELAGVRKALNAAGAPASGRVAVVDTEADAALITIPALVNAEKSGSTSALRSGALGRVYGVDYYSSQAVKRHVTGIGSASEVRLAAATQAGDTQLQLSGAELTGCFKQGDLMRIAGRSYTVLSDSAPAEGNAIADVSVYPALPALSKNTAVELLGSHTANLAFHPLAFAFVTRPLINPDGQGVESYVTSYRGISLRVTKGYDQRYKRSVYSMDVLYGFKTVYPELAVRLLG